MGHPEIRIELDRFFEVRIGVFALAVQHQVAEIRLRFGFAERRCLRVCIELEFTFEVAVENVVTILLDVVTKIFLQRLERHSERLLKRLFERHVCIL